MLLNINTDDEDDDDGHKVSYVNICHFQPRFYGFGPNHIHVGEAWIEGEPKNHDRKNSRHGVRSRPFARFLHYWRNNMQKLFIIGFDENGNN